MFFSMKTSMMVSFQLPDHTGTENMATREA